MGLKAPAAMPADERQFNRWCRETELDYIHRGSGSPEGVVLAPRGHLYLRDDGGAGTTFYVKESGDTLTTGWAAK
jgi:hypothetical protein